MAYTVELEISELRRGDVVLHPDGRPAYTLMEDVHESVDENDAPCFAAKVAWLDGGNSVRLWYDGSKLVETLPFSVRRKES